MSTTESFSTTEECTTQSVVCTSLEIFPTFLHCAIAQSLAYHLCPCPSHDVKVNVNKKESCLSANFLLRWIVPIFVRQEKLQDSVRLRIFYFRTPPMEGTGKYAEIALF